MGEGGFFSPMHVSGFIAVVCFVFCEWSFIYLFTLRIFSTGDFFLRVVLFVLRDLAPVVV